MYKPILEMLAPEKARLVRGAVRSVTGIALLALLVLAATEGLSVALLGGYVSLTRTFQPWEAGVLLGLPVFLLAVLALTALPRLATRKVRERPGARLHAPASQRHAAADRTAAEPSELLGAALGDLLGKADLKARDIAVAALVAGLALGASPRLRRYVFGRRNKP